jgi:phosphonoacetaldehyde hydrolase
MQIDVLKEYAEPIPGCLDAIGELREYGIKVGSTTGYIRSMMDVLAPVAKEKGYEPDCIVCPDDVPAGRPFPWMVYQNLMQLGVYPMQSVVKVGDTLADIEEGLNAGAWTVGLSLTGNLLGLSQDEFNLLSDDEQLSAQQKVEDQLYRAGAHYVIDGIWDLPDLVEEINDRLLEGESPA